jgi:hypothetical protein
LLVLSCVAGCAKHDVELLAPRQDAGSSSRDAGAGGELDAGAGGELDAGAGGGLDAGAPFPSSDGGDGGGRGDAASEDAGPTACPAGSTLCEGFETSLAGWTFVRSDGTAVATTQESRSGVGALELSTRSVGAYAYLERQLTPLVSGSVHLRAFLKLPSDAPIDSYDVVILANAAVDKGVAVSVAADGLSLSAVATSSGASSKIAFPRDTWFCLELALGLSATPSATVSVDGEGAAATLTTQDVPDDGYSKVAVGVVRAQPTQPATRVLIDDVAIGSSPFGCQ